MDAWLKRHYALPLLLFAIIKVVVLVVRTTTRIEASGREKLPPRGPYLLSPNHQSYLDPFFVIGCLPYRIVRQLFFVGASEYFETALMRWFARQINLIPVDPDASLVSAMQAGAAGLRRGRILVLFPEGERSIDGTVRSFKKGASILAHHLAVPIVPVGIDGLFDVWGRNRQFRWRKLAPGSGATIRLRIGDPILPESDLPVSAGNEAAYLALTTRLRNAVVILWQSIAARPEATDRAHVS
jgi:long-chain acyl-CoA synthetase